MTEGRGAFSPLVNRTFRWLWLALAVSNVGLWMQALGAQWFLVDQMDSSATVALVQTALMLPMAVLALPAGALADNVDRRKLLIAVQLATLAVGTVLTTSAFLGVLDSKMLLVLTMLVGSGAALTLTPFQSLVPDLLPREQVTPAAALTNVGTNFARIVGPAIAGLLVAFVGIPAVFAVHSIAAAFFVIVLLRWKGVPGHPRHRERFFPAMRSGLRYVRHSPQVLKVMLRSFCYTAPMMAIFALLPIVATQRLGMGSGGYGLLFASLGAGAIVGAISLSRLRISYSANVIVASYVLLAAVVTLTLPFVSSPWVAIPLLLAAGASWTATNAAMTSMLQVYLPAWVRARGLALYYVALFGGQAIGSVVVGWIAHKCGMSVAFVSSAIFLFAGATMVVWLPLKDVEGLDRTPTQPWPEPNLIVDPDELPGEVAVVIVYWIDPADEEPFVRLMKHLRRTRLRTGASSWKLYKDSEVPRRFVEVYFLASWEEHVHQHQGRLVASDQVIEDQVVAMSNPAREVQQLFRVTGRDSGWL